MSKAITLALVLFATQAALAKLPLRFEVNQGQTDAGVKYIARGAGYALFLTAIGAVLELPDSESQVTVLRMNLVGTKPNLKITGEEELPGRSNYFVGSDPAHWHTAIPNYARVRYREVYPGVDLVYYGDQGQLEYDFLVAPGACPQVIRLAFSGIKGVQIDANGDLLLDTGHSGLRQHRPRVYQLAPDGRRTITGSYRLDAGGRVGFEIGEYDTSLPLVIDPVLSYSTYLGGNRWDAAHAMAVDASGNVYITGETFSTNFPAPGGSSLTLMGSKNVFVAKLNPSGTALLYSTLIGGSQIEWGQAIAVDAGGNAYIIGTTYSSNFPVTSGAFSTNYGGQEDVFVSKLNPAGALVYSTYLGAAGRDFAAGVAVDGSGNAYVTGYTSSTNFPVTTGAIQSAHHGGYQDVFVTKVNPAGSALVYSTYIGGSGNDTAGAIAVDGAGNAYITGGTDSGDFPVVNPLQASRAWGSDAFVLKINPAGNALVFSTYLGGNGLEYGAGIAVDSTGAVYVTGSTNSTDFPVSGGAPQRVNAGSSDVFVTKLNPGGNTLAYSTYLGGSGAEGGAAIAVDRAGNAWVGGVTYSANFPLRDPTQSSFGGVTDGFVAILNAAGTSLLFSTFVGGGADDYIYGIALDGSENGYVTGSTLSSNFPTTSGVLQPAYAGGGDAFVAKLPPVSSGGSNIGVYRGGLWFVDWDGDRQWDSTDAAHVFAFGFPGDLPVMGDWNGDGRLKAGVFRNGCWFVDWNGNNQWDATDAAHVFCFGLPGDLPVRGDWNGDGRLKAGVFRNGCWFVDWNGNNQWDAEDAAHVFCFGLPGDLPVMGDWNGDGRLKVGVFRKGLWFLDWSGKNRWDPQDAHVFVFGLPGDLPVMGDWNGDGRLKVGVFRNGCWFVDWNGNNQWDAEDAAHVFCFGLPGDLPVVSNSWSAGSAGRTTMDASTLY